jgi:hypothetical protein
VNFVVICESYLVFVEKSLIFLRGFDPHFTVCLGFSALRSEHFFFSSCTWFSQPSFWFNSWGVFGPLTRPPPLLRISFTARLDFHAACLLVSVRRQSSAPLKLMPQCYILLVARVSQSPLATGLWSDPFPSPVAGPGFQ